MLWAARVAGASRVMAFLGPALIGHHFRDIWSVTLDRNPEGFHPNPFTLRIERCWHNPVDEQLNILGKVRSQPFTNTAA
jgi:hypothetical protein